MDIRAVVEALELYTRESNPYAVFVLQKVVENTRMNAFKRFIYTIWYVDKSTKYKAPYITVSRVDRVTSPEEEAKVVKSIEEDLVIRLFRSIRTSDFNLILGGSYGDNEPISNTNN
jgi:hypothetical protein